MGAVFAWIVSLAVVASNWTHVLSQGRSVVQMKQVIIITPEKDGKVSVPVVRTGDLSTKVEVEYTSHDGSAQVGRDFYLSGNRHFVTFNVGQSAVNISVPIVDDQEPEKIQIFVVQLSSPSAPHRLGLPQRTYVAIVDDDKVSTCGTSEVGERGQFNSPGYPNEYKNNSNCEWNITVSEDSRIMLTFHGFDIEGLIYSTELTTVCDFDKLEIWEDNARWLRMCGSHEYRPMIILSKGNNFRIRFESDFRDTFQGFMATWEATPQNECPIGSREFNGKCYHFSTLKVPFEIAEERCAMARGHLVMTSSCCLQNYLGTVLKEYSHLKRWWIDGRRINPNSREFWWHRGRMITYADFKTSYPRLGHGNCLALEQRSSKIINYLCNETLPFICELPGPDSNISDTGLSCASRETKFRHSCFRMHHTNSTFKEASIKCAEGNAKLVTINECCEMEFLKTFATSSNNKTASDWFIGLIQTPANEAQVPPNTKQYKYLDGSVATYQNWAYGQPNSSDQACVTVSPGAGFKFLQAVCDARYSFICERPVCGILDITLVLSSTSTAGEWERLLSAAMMVVWKLDIGSSATRVAVITYNDTATVSFDLLRHGTLSTLQYSILHIGYPGSSTTNVQLALQAALDKVFVTSKGDRFDAPNIVIILTTKTSAAEYHLAKATVTKMDESKAYLFGIAVGSGASSSHLRSIIPAQSTYQVATIEDIVSQKNALLTKACQISVCNNLDLVFLLDDSDRLDRSNWKTILKSTQQLVNMLPVDPSHVRIGLATYATNTTVSFHLNGFTTRAEIVNALERLPFRGGERNTADGVKNVRTQMYNLNNGDRPATANVIVVVTHGKSNMNVSEVKDEAYKARIQGATIFVVGVGAFGPEEIKSIASQPQDEHTYQQTNFTELADNLLSLGKRICQVKLQIFPVDLAFVVDDSSGVDSLRLFTAMSSKWKGILDCIKQIVKRLAIGRNLIRVGMVTFTSIGKVQFLLDQYSTTEQLLQAINSVTHTGGSFNLESGLETVRTKIYGQNGDRLKAKNVAVLLLTKVTKGRKYISAIKRLNDFGIGVAAIAFGNQVPVKTLKELISLPKEEHTAYWIIADDKRKKNMPDEVKRALPLLQLPEHALIFEFVNSSHVAYEGEEVGITILRKGGNGSAEIQFYTASGTAVAGQDFIPTRQTVTFADIGNKTIYIDIVNDMTLEQEEYFTAYLEPLAGYTKDVLGDVSATNITIAENDNVPGYLHFTKSNVLAGEDTGDLTLTVRRFNGTYGGIYVLWYTKDGTAKSPTDYIHQLHSLTFEDGETEKNITVTIIDDSQKEDEEYFSVILCCASVDVYVTEPAEVSVKITANDEVAGQVAFMNTSLAVPENVGQVQLIVQRYDGMRAANVTWYTLKGGALPTEDYIAQRDQLLFQEGEMEKTINVSIVDDTRNEQDELFYVVLCCATMGLQLAQPRIATVTIKRNDRVPGTIGMTHLLMTVPEEVGVVQVEVTRTADLHETTTVDWTTINGTAVSGVDFIATRGRARFNVGQSALSLSIPILDDQIPEKLKTFLVLLLSASPPDAVGSDRTFIVINMSDPEVGRVSFLRSSYAYEETAGQINITVERSNGSHGIVTLTWYTRSITARPLQDYSGGPEVITFEHGETRKVITLSIVDDRDHETEEDFQIVLSQPTGGLVLGDIPVTRVTIRDNDDTGALQFEASRYWVNETDLQVTLKVMRVNGSAGRVYAVWRTAEGTARSPEDYPFQEGRLVFDNGVTEASLNISVENDRVSEFDEHFTIVLLNLKLGATLGHPNEANVTIKARLHGKASFQKAAYVFNESAIQIRIPVVRMSGSSGVVALAWRTQPLTASSNEDYYGEKGTLTFKDGETYQLININIVDDKVQEEDERFQIVLSQPTGGLAFGNILVTTITILKNDGAPGVLQFDAFNYWVNETDQQVTLKVLRLNGSAGRVYAVWRTAEGTARSPEDYPFQEGRLVFDDGVTEASLNISVENDRVTELDEYFTVSLINANLGATLGYPSEANVTIKATLHGQASFLTAEYVFEENVGRIRIPVERTNGSAGSVTLAWRTKPLTASSTQDYKDGQGILTFKDGVTKEFIYINILDDKVPEEDELFQIVLSQPTGGLVLGNLLVTTIKILKNDADPSQLQFETSNYRVKEQDEQVTLKVLRVKGKAGMVYGLWRTEMGTARHPDDYPYQEGQLVFPDGVAEVSFNVTVEFDTAAETDEYFKVTLINIPLGAVLGSPTEVNVTIQDTYRQPGEVSFLRTSYEYEENAGQINISVERFKGNYGIVTFTWYTRSLAAKSPEDYFGGPEVLTFQDGETKKVITLKIVDDTTPEGDEVFEIMLSQPTGGLVVGDIPVTRVKIHENDGPGALQFEAPNYWIREIDQQVTLKVLRVNGSAGRVYGLWRTVEGTARNPDDYQYQEGRLVFEDGVTEASLNISVDDDGVSELDEYFTVTLFNLNLGATLGYPYTATVTIKSRLHGQSSFQKAEYVFNENAGQVPISVERKNGSDGRVAVEWRTVPLTATSPEDYDGAQGTLTFKDGETEQLIYIYIVDDKVPEEDERFQIVLSQPTGGLSLGNIHVTTIRIFKNDGVPGKLQFKMSNYRVEEKDEQVTLTVLRVRGSAGRVYGMWRTVEGTARHPHDYPYQEGLLKFDDGVTEVNFNVSVEYDAPAETDEYFKVILINIPLGAALGSPTEANVTIQDTPMPTTTTTATTTIATTTISTTAPACGDIADVVFIIDSSGSIRDNDPPGRNNWKDLLSFVSDVIGKWDIGTRQVRVGLVTFSNLGNYKWSLNTYTQKGALQERVKRVGYSGGRTNLSAGLLVARNRVFQRYAGDRAGVPNIAVVITDGAYSSKKADVQRELNQYQKLEIRIFAVGITRQAQEDQVKSISSDPSVRGINYWMAPGFQDLNAIRDGLVAALNPYTKVKCP